MNAATRRVAASAFCPGVITMAAWLKVFCTRPIRHVTDKDILTGLDFTDPYSTAESYGLDDDDAVDQALAWLRITQMQGKSKLIGIWYRPIGTRPVWLHLGGEPSEIEKERDEELEGLEGIQGAGATTIRKHLARTVDIAAFELGWSQISDMGIVFAGQAAEYLARVGDGIIRDQDERWWKLARGRPVLLHSRD